MSIFPGDLGGIGIGPEGTYGTGVAAAAFLQSRPGSTMGKQQNVDEVDALTITKLTSRTRGSWVSGPFSFIPNYAANAAFRALLEHVFGLETGVGPYVYSIQDPSDQAGLSVLKDLGGRVERFIGSKVTSFELVVGAGFVQCNVDVIGQSMDHPSPVTITHTADATLMHSNDLSIFSLGGTDFLAAVKELKVKMDIPHTGEERLFLGSDTIGEPQRNGPRAITVSAQIELRDAAPDVTALTDLWEANTTIGDMIFQLTSGSLSLNVTADDLTAIGDPITLDSGPALWTLNAQASDFGCTWDQVG